MEQCKANWTLPAIGECVPSTLLLGLTVGHVSASSLFITFQHRQSHFYDFPVSVSVSVFGVSFYIFFPLAFRKMFPMHRRRTILCFRWQNHQGKGRKKSSLSNWWEGAEKITLLEIYLTILLIFHCRTCPCPAWVTTLWQPVKCKAPVASLSSIATIWRLQSQFRIQFQLHLSTLSTCHSLPIEIGECSHSHSHSHFHFHSLCRIYSFKVRVNLRSGLRRLFARKQSLSGTRSSLGSLIVVRFWHWLISWAKGTVINSGTCS